MYNRLIYRLSRMVNRPGLPVTEVQNHAFMEGGENPRIVIAGFGRMGRLHGALLHGIGYRVTGVCDPVDECRSRAVDVIPGVTTYADLGDVDADAYDLVIIATLAADRLDIIRQGIDKNIQKFLCEKPILNTVGDCVELRNLVAASDIRVSVNHPRRWCRDYSVLRTRILTGEFGTLRSAGGVIKPTGLGNMGVHYLDLLMWLTGVHPHSAGGFYDFEDSSGDRGGFALTNGRCFIEVDNGIEIYVDSTVSANETDGQKLFLCFEKAEITIFETKGIWSLVQLETGKSEQYRFDEPVGGDDWKKKSRPLFLHRAIQGLCDNSPAFDLEPALLAVETLIATQVAQQSEQKRIFLPIAPKTATPWPFS